MDALEALHPGVLRQILEQEIARYYDSKLAQRTNAKAKQVTATLNKFNTQVHARYAEQIEELQEEYGEVVAAHQAWLHNAETCHQGYA